MTYLTLSFFDTFQAIIDGNPVTNFRSAKVQGLLIYLAMLNQQLHERDVLAALLWPDEPDATAKKNLRQSIYQLRQILGENSSREEPFLLVTRSTIHFNPKSDHSLDVEDFLASLENRQFEQSLALYQGDLLPGFSCDSLPFEDWLRLERERLHRLALDALYELTAHNLAMANYQAAQRLARRQLALEPWREVAHRQLMQALTLLGERSAAMAQYEACQAVLQEELGIKPSTETRDLANRIRDQQLQRDFRIEPAQSFERRRLIIPFVGRKIEHDRLTQAYWDITLGGFQAVALLGETGIGKTRLAQNFLDWAATQGADILRSQAFETSGRLSYQPLTQALRQRLERENAPEDLLSDLWLTQLTRILPELRDRYPDLPEPTQQEAAARQHLFEAITRVCLSLSQLAPLVILLDDWHWADAASLDVLHYAALRWREERASILVLMTLRHEALSESIDLYNWLARFTHDIACTEINLSALSDGETGQLIQMLLDPASERAALSESDEKQSHLPGFIRWLYQETDGQPLFLVEMLKVLLEEGLIQPDANSQAWVVNWEKFKQQALEPEMRVLPKVREMIGARLDSLNPPAKELLAAAAVLGQQASFDYLCKVARLEENQALPALDELLDRQLLLETDEPSSALGGDAAYAFSHHLMRELVYSEAGAARRKILHRRAFKVLREAAAPAAELARHALNAGLHAEAFRYSLNAGNEAMRLFAARVAIPHYDTAWELAKQLGWPEIISGADRQELYTRLGRAYELTEAWQSALATYQAMLGYARAHKAASIECLALNRLATVYANGLNDPQQAIALLEQARTAAEQNGDQRGLAETEWNLSIAYRLRHETRLAQQHGEQALVIARQLGHPQLLARCLNSLAYAHVFLRQWDKVEANANEAARLYAASGDRILEADCQRLVGWSQMYTGRPHASLATLQETFAFSQQIENLWGQAECAWRLAITLMDLGQYGKAIELAEQAVEQARLVGQPPMILLTQLSLGTVQQTLMAMDAARKTLLRAVDDFTEKGLTAFKDWATSELCTIYAVAGDWTQALAYARQSLLFREERSLQPMVFTGYFEIEALLRGRNRELAQGEVERLGKVVGDNQRYHILWLRSLAVLAKWDNRPGQAATYLQDALALTREIGLPGEEWSILGALGTLYANQGKHDEARQARNASADIIQRLAASIEDEDLRAGYLAARPIRSILDGN